MSTSERFLAVLVNAGIAFGVGYWWLGCPLWAALMWFSLENGIVSLRPRKKA